MANLKRVGIWNLRLGMVIVKCDKMGVPFFDYGKPLSNLDFVQSLADFGVQNVYIWVDDAPAVKSVPKQEYIVDKQDNIQSLEIAAATELLIRTKKAVETVLNDLKKGHLNLIPVQDSINEIVESCIDTPGIFTGMARLAELGDDEYNHALNVAVISVTIGQLANMNRKALMDLGTAGLLHDIGKYRIPSQIINKKTQLTEQELLVFRRHPEFGHDMLMRSQGLNSDIAIAVMQHHEYFDGTGYPSNLKGQYISTAAKILSVVEAYQTMIYPNNEYYPVLHNTDAIKKIYTCAGKQFSPEVVKIFITAMGIYPVSTVVKLSNNDIAIVSELNIKEPMKPRVLSLGANAKGERKLIDLARNAIKIIAPVNNTEIDFDPQAILNDFLSYMLNIRING